MVNSNPSPLEKELDLSILDPRIKPTLCRAGDLLFKQSGRSFSSVLGNSLRQSVSHSFQKVNMNPKVLLSGHIDSSVERCLSSDYSTILVAQDSTYYNLSGHKKMTGLLPIQGKVLGSVQHNVLALSSSGSPLGLLYQHNWTRGGEGSAAFICESDKWFAGLNAVNKHLGNKGKKVVLIQDRESDIFDFMTAERSGNIDLVLRMYQNRQYEYKKEGADESEIGNLRDTSANLCLVGHKTVEIQRDNKSVWIKLGLYAGKVSVLPPKNAPEGTASVEMTMIRAVEVEAEDVNFKDVFKPSEAVEWLLLTTISLDQSCDAATVVGYYAKRWTIERLHFVQKSGAYNVEKLQFADIHTFFNALAFYSILAWKTLALNYLIRQEPETPALNVFDKQEVETLEAITQSEIKSIQQAEVGLNKIAKFRPTKAQPHLGVKKMAQTIYDLQLISFGFHINIKT
jgi:hypothetical protein